MSQYGGGYGEGDPKGSPVPPGAPWWLSELAAYWSSGETNERTRGAAGAAIGAVGDMHAALASIADSLDVPAQALAAETLDNNAFRTDYVGSITLLQGLGRQLTGDMMAAIYHHLQAGQEKQLAKVMAAMFATVLAKLPPEPETIKFTAELFKLIREAVGNSITEQLMERMIAEAKNDSQSG